MKSHRRKYKPDSTYVEVIPYIDQQLFKLYGFPAYKINEINELLDSVEYVHLSGVFLCYMVTTSENSIDFFWWDGNDLYRTSFNNSAITATWLLGNTELYQDETRQLELLDSFYKKHKMVYNENFEFEFVEE